MSPTRIPSSPPPIEPVPGNLHRPLWSIMIPTYNCIGYLTETIESVLSQDWGVQDMQIEVIDDCSTDGDVEGLVKEIGKGRVAFFRQEKNVGSLRNFETCIQKSRGRWIHILHGDDKLKPGFYKEIEHLFNDFPSAGAAFTGLSGIDENGHLIYHSNYIQGYRGIIQDWLLKISQQQCLQACAMVVKRDVYEKLGGFFGAHYGEDWEMWVRIAANFPVAYSPENFALYRHHNTNISSRFLASGQNIKDIRSVIDIIQGYLPVDKRKEIRNISKKFFSIYFTKKAQGIYKKHRNGTVALKQAHGALNLHFNHTTVTSLLKLYLKILIKYKSAN